MIPGRLYLSLVILAACPGVALAQPGHFLSGLHYTRDGKETWYGVANGGFETFTGIPIEDLPCKNCHGPTNADGLPYPDDYRPGCRDCHQQSIGGTVVKEQCLSCHSRQAYEAMLGFTDAHLHDLEYDCWECHTAGDNHGDGTEYASLLDPRAIDADCEDCHISLSAEHREYDPHCDRLHCTACHTTSVIACYNCHFESLVEGHVKRAKQPIGGYLMLVNREEDGKVYTATFQALT
ncbi:MAG: cytochrome c3 family protein [Planctomycetota bacterium]